MEQMLSYRELARYYDLIYLWKDYEAEATTVDLLIRKHCRSKGKELLDVACGTGTHLGFLRKRYSVTGLDQSPEMLAVARRKFPGLKVVRADMTTFSLPKQFDAVICLFSAIGHLKTYEKLDRALGQMAKHLKPGGVLLIEPFLAPTAYRPGKPHASFVDLPDLKIARMNVAARRGRLAILDFHYLVATSRGVRRYHDYVELGLFEQNKVLALLRKHGLSGRFIKNGFTKDRGLYLAVK